MANSTSNTKSSSTTKQNQTTKSSTMGYSQGGSNTASQSQGGGHSYTTGGGHSETSTEGHSHSVTNSYQYGEANQQSQGKSWLSGEVEGNTAAQRNQLHNGGYEQSDQVNQTYQRLQDTLNNKPGAFTSSFQDQMQNMYNQIMNRGKFSYDFNADPMYRALRDSYTAQGQQAMENTMGNAAALTGGYGNSYAQTAGQQMYQQYLQQLNDRLPELRNEAFNEWKAEGEDLRDKLNLANVMYQQEYGQHRDEVADWQADRNFDQSNYQSERNFDYNKWNADRNYWNEEYWKERSAEQSNAASAHSTNWQRGTSETNTDYSEHSTTDSSNWSSTDSTNWSNAVSQTQNWQASLQNAISQMQGLTQTNSQSNTVGTSTGSGSGSGSGGSSNGFTYKADSHGNIVADRKGYENGSTAAANLTKNAANKSMRDMNLGYLTGNNGQSTETKLQKALNGKRWMPNKDDNTKGKWVNMPESEKWSDADVLYFEYRLGLLK